MYEKYDAFEVGVGGGGGEYVPQVGFGWTNGVALYLLNHSLSAARDRVGSDDVLSDDGSEEDIIFDAEAIFGVVGGLLVLLVCSAGAGYWYQKLVSDAATADAVSVLRVPSEEPGGGARTRAAVRGGDATLSQEISPLVSGAPKRGAGPVPAEDIELVDKV
jgi:hypothetical protein